MKDLSLFVSFITLVIFLGTGNIFAGFVFVFAIFGYLQLQHDSNLNNKDFQRRKFIKSTKKHEKEEYYSNGNLKSHYFYDDKIDGWVTKDYYEDNVLKREKISNKKDSYITKNYRINGVLSHTLDYTGHRRTMKDYYKNGNVALEITTESDGLVIEKKYFNEDGTLNRTERPNNKKEIEEKKLLIEPKKEILTDDLCSKEGLYYYQKDDTPYTGRVVDYHENGKTRTEEWYKDGKIDGIRKTWNDEGKQLSQTEFKNHVLCVKKTWWNYYGEYLGVLHTENHYENGNLICEKRYAPNGKRNFIKLYQDGKFKNIRRYHSNDIIKLEEIYLNGKRDGIWRFWDEDGLLTGEEFYEKGKKVEPVNVNNVVFENNTAYHKKNNSLVTGYVKYTPEYDGQSTDYIAYKNGIRDGFSRYGGGYSEYYKKGEIHLISKTLEQ